MNEWLYTAEGGFEAARRNGRGLHGHSFAVRVRADNHPPAGDHETLSATLTQCLAPLDYALVNDVVETGADPDLACWIHGRLAEAAVPVRRVALRSAPDRGVVLEAGAWRAWRRFRFEAAHRLPHVPAGHPCGRMHGHGFEVILEAEAAAGEAAGEAAWARAEAAARAWRPLQEQLHHHCLNDFLENPTSEMLAAWIWARLEPEAPGLARVRVHETEHSGCVFDGRRYAIWKAQRFEAATRLRDVAAGSAGGDRRDRLHGHGYRLRLHLVKDLDAVLGWTVDYGDVKRAFEPVLRRLDHYPLYEIDGLEDGAVATLGRWIVARTLPQLPWLSRVDLYERPGCGVICAPEERGGP